MKKTNDDVQPMSTEDLENTAGGFGLRDIDPFGVVDAVETGVKVACANSGTEAGEAIGGFAGRQIGGTVAAAELVTPIPGSGVVAGMIGAEVAGSVGKVVGTGVGQVFDS